MFAGILQAVLAEKEVLWLDNRSYAERVKIAALPCLLLVMIYCLIGPLDIVSSNAVYLNYSFQRVLVPAILLTLGLWICMTAVLSLLKGRVFTFFVCLIFAFAVASYVEGGLQYTQLTALDGSSIAWEEIGSTVIKDLLLWTLIFSACFIALILLKPARKRLLQGASVLLILMQLIGLSFNILTHPEATKPRDALSAKEQYTVSSENNVIVLMLDATSDDAINVMLDAFPDALNGLNDFTRYTDYIPRYYNTFPGMLYMLTGYEYDCEQIDWQEYMYQAWTSPRAESFYDTLKEKGYQVNIFAETASVCGTKAEALVGKVDNVKNTGAAISEPVSFHTLSKLLRVSCYRYFPMIAKACFRAYTGDLTEKKNAINLADDFWMTFEKDGLVVDESSNRFIFQGLQGLHQPYTMNQYAEQVYSPTECEQACGYFLEITRFLDELKRLNLYDQATVIITADHGRYKNGGGAPYDTKEWPCLMMIKQPYETHDQMVLNAAPVAQSDFMGTVMACIDPTSEAAANSVFAWQEGDQRERKISIRERDPNKPDDGTRKALYEYTFKNLDEIQREKPDEIYSIVDPFYVD